MRLNGVEVDAGPLRQRLGLAEDADDAVIYQALGIEPEAEPAQGELAPEPVAASGPQVPAGMVLVDQETFEQVRHGAQQGAEVAARIARQDRDQTITAAIQEGRFPVSRRGHYEQAWDRDPDGTRTLLTASVADGGLATGLVPVGAREVGQSGDGDGQPAAAEAEHEAVMARFYPNEHARRTGANGRARIRQEA